MSSSIEEGAKLKADVAPEITSSQEEEEEEEAAGLVGGGAELRRPANVAMISGSVIEQQPPASRVVTASSSMNKCDGAARSAPHLEAAGRVVAQAHQQAPLLSGAVSEVEGGKDDEDDEEEEDVDDDESEYSYEDEDDAGFSGFLATDSFKAGSVAAPAQPAVSVSAPARIVDDDEEEQPMAPAARRPPERQDSSASSVAAAAPEIPKKKKWKEPTREAVNMSLRAERETSGSKRRLLSELYQIMMRDTKENGFRIEPTDSMDRWAVQLFQFDADSMLAQDLEVLGLDHVQLEMRFPNDYPFEPPFVRVVQPKFKRQTGFVMNGALCMELLTKDGWSPINDIESVIVSIRSLLVVGEGRLQAAVDMGEERRQAILSRKKKRKSDAKDGDDEGDDTDDEEGADDSGKSQKKKKKKVDIGSYSVQEAESAHAHLTDYHKKKGWDSSGWWAKKG